MNIIIPLGGVGSRFTVEGYTRPKPLIRVLGKEMIRWVLDSLDLQPADQVQLRPAHKTWALTCQPGSNPYTHAGLGSRGVSYECTRPTCSTMAPQGPHESVWGQP
jgi:hypothetical protein